MSAPANETRRRLSLSDETAADDDDDDNFRATRATRDSR